MEFVASTAESPVPIVGRVFSVILSLLTTSTLAICLSRRLESVLSWRQFPPARWPVYIDSFAFVFLTAVLDRGFGMDGLLNICKGAQLLCLLCYLTSKFIYLFLVEKAYIIRGKSQPRLKDKLYLFNFFVMLCPYMGMFILNFVFRFQYLSAEGMCYMGIWRVAIIPTLSWEVVVNVYLTLLFLVPIRKLYSYRNNTHSTLRTVAVRTFVGSCATLASSVINISILLAYEKEPSWVCLMICNADILFSVLVLHWVTSVDTIRKQPSSARYGPSANNSRPFGGREYDADGNAISTREWTVRKPANQGVTTRITATIDEEDMMEVPMDTIAVKTKQVQHVETDGSSLERGMERSGSTDKIVGN